MTIIKRSAGPSALGSGKGCVDGGVVWNPKKTERSEIVLTPNLPASRKEVIQPQVPLRLPCYDFTPVADLTVAGCFLAVRSPS